MTRYLKISDGTTTINFDDPTVDGIQLNSYVSNLPGWKGGGIKQDSPISDDAKLVHRQFDAVSDMAVVTIVGQSQDLMIAKWRALEGMLEKAAKYWLEKHNSTPVYLIKKGDTETTTHYALIYGYKIDELPNLYGGGFEVGANANGVTYASALVNIKIGIDHAAWSTVAPIASTATNISSTYSWLYNSGVTLSLSKAISRIICCSTGELLAINGLELWRSTDAGENWASIATGQTGAQELMETTAGRVLLCDDGQILKSDDKGATWGVATSSPSAIVTAIVQTTTGRILAAESGVMWTSVDNGDTWSSYAITNLISSMLITQTGKIVANGVYASVDDGVSWSYVPATGSGIGGQTSTGKIVLMGRADEVVVSTNDASSFSTVTANLDDENLAGSQVFVASNGYVYALYGGQIWYSEDDAITWELFSNNAGTFMAEYTDGTLFWSYSTYVVKYSLGDTVSLGASSSSSENSHVSNKQIMSNLTHIFVDDGGVFGSNLLPMTSFPVTLLPAAPAVNDAIYFIVDPAKDNTGPFDSLVFDISVPAKSTTSYTILWEYVSAVGAGPGFALTWSTLAAQDGTNYGGGALSSIGVNSIHWSRTQSGAWIPTGDGSINSIANCWAIRARVSALTGTLTPPTQQNRNIYSCVLPYVNVASTEINGDIPAIVEIQAKNQSDLDGAAGSAPNLYENRMVIGLREYSRGTNFTPYINFSDEQNPFGITVAVGTSSAFATAITAPTGRKITNTSAIADTSFANQATVTFSATIARDFYGKFRAFVRAQQTDGTVGEITHRLQVKSGSGGILYTSPEVQYITKNGWQLLEFGEISLPVSAYLDYDELGDSSVIALQTKNSSGAQRIMYFYDLILMPADEWIIDAVDEAKTTSSIIGQVSSVKRYLDVDSISIPKVPIRALVRQDNANNLIVSSYKAVSSDRAILKPDIQQRLYFLAATSGSTTGEWASNCEICHSVKVYKQERYLSLVGNP